MKLRYFLLATTCISATLSQAMWSRLTHPFLTKFGAHLRSGTHYVKPLSLFTAGALTSLTVSKLLTGVPKPLTYQYDCNKEIARMHQKAVNLSSYGASIDDPNATAAIFKHQAHLAFIQCQQKMSPQEIMHNNIVYSVQSLSNALDTNEYRQASSWRKTIDDLQKAASQQKA